MADAAPTWQAAIRALRPKITPPAQAGGQVPHDDLLDHFLSARAVRLVTLVAPAGYGKTSTMCHLFERLRAAAEPVAWLTLDGSDADVARLQTSLAAAVDLAVGGLAGVSGELRGRIAAAPPFTLFVDDVDTINGTEAIRELREILDLMPPGARIVAGARRSPDFSLAKLRARGQLIEIGRDELAFSVARTRTFLEQFPGSRLSEADLVWLHRKTEGWIAGLRLVAAAMSRYPSRHDFMKRMAAAERPLAEYLSEDILARLSGDLRDFLIRTSILRELEPALCEALVPGTDALAMLQRLMAGNVMLTRLDGSEPSYRIHPMFADFLRDQLRDLPPEEVRGLHRTAAHWFDGHGRPVPAIDHYLDCGDLAAAAGLLDRHGADLYLQGRMQLLSRWFERIGGDVLERHPDLRMLRLWVLCFTRGPSRAAEELGLLPADADAHPVMGSHLNALRPMLHVMLERHEQARQAGLAALSRLPTGNPLADNQLLHAMANIAVMSGPEDEVGRLLLDEHAFGDGSPIAAMYREVLTALRDFFAGHVAKAAVRFRIAMEVVGTGTESRRNHAWPGILCGMAAYEAGDLAEARSLLQSNLQGSKDAGLVDHTIVGYRLLARMAIGAGQVEDAFRLLAELEHYGRQRQLRRVRAAAALERGRIHLMQGNPRAARSEFDQAEDKDITATERDLRLVASDIDYQAIAHLRLTAFEGNARQAVQEADRQIETATASGRIRRAIALRLIRAVALQRAGGETEALRSLRDALRTCMHEGFVRLVLDEGPRLGRLVRELARARTFSLDNALQEYVQRLLDAFGPMPAPADLPQPLTATEIRVLGLLEAGHSNKSMAEALFVSENTVRAHLRNINVKLGASSRLEAISLARRLGVDF